jgi:hypothetical protein
MIIKVAAQIILEILAFTVGKEHCIPARTEADSTNLLQRCLFANGFLERFMSVCNHP